MNFGGGPVLSRGILKPLACVAFALTVLGQPAVAATVRLDGFFYDIQFYGLGNSFENVVSVESPPIRETRWWGNETLARALADAYLAQVNIEAPPFTEDESRFTQIRFAFEENLNEDTGDPASVTYAFVQETPFEVVGINPFTRIATDDQSSGTNGSDNGVDNVTYAFAASVTPVPLPPAGMALGVALLGLMGLRRWKAAGTSRTA